MNNTIPVPLVDYTLPEKLTETSKEVLDAVGALKAMTGTNRVSVRLVLADYCAHVSTYDEKGNTLKTITVNNDLYVDWQDGVISCNKRNFTYGEDVLTTLTSDKYCEHVVYWDLHHSSVVTDDISKVTATLPNDMPDAPIKTTAFYKWLDRMRKQYTVPLGELSVDIRRYLATSVGPDGVHTDGFKGFRFGEDYISDTSFKILKLIHNYYFKNLAEKTEK